MAELTNEQRKTPFSNLRALVLQAARMPAYRLQLHDIVNEATRAKGQLNPPRLRALAFAIGRLAEWGDGIERDPGKKDLLVAITELADIGDDMCRAEGIWSFED